MLSFVSIYGLSGRVCCYHIYIYIFICSIYLSNYLVLSVYLSRLDWPEAGREQHLPALQDFLRQPDQPPDPQPCRKLYQGGQLEK